MLASMPIHCSALPQRPVTGVYAMVGVVAGSALQLQQSALFSPGAYVAIAGAAVALAMVLGWWIKPARSRAWCVLALAMVLAWGCTGWRAAAFQQTAMPAAWEGRDVRVEGGDDMPQTTARGVRMRFDIEHAWAQGMPIRLPEGVMLTWYGELPAEGLQAGQRWAWTVRLKAPHGETEDSTDWGAWLWSQGVQATGYVRQHRSVNGEGAPPQWLAQQRGHRWRSCAAACCKRCNRQREHQRVSRHRGRGTGLGDRGSVPHHACRLAIVQRYGRCPLGQHQWLAHHNVCVAGCGAGQCRMAPQCALLLVAASAAGSGMGWLVLGHGVRRVQRLGHSGSTHDWHAAGGGALAYPRAHMALACGVVDGADRVVLLDPWSLLQAGFWLSFVAVGVLFAAQPPDRNRREKKYRHAGLRLLRGAGQPAAGRTPALLLVGHRWWACWWQTCGPYPG